jgi:hypothetical protein
VSAEAKTPKSAAWQRTISASYLICHTDMSPVLSVTELGGVVDEDPQELLGANALLGLGAVEEDLWRASVSSALEEANPQSVHTVTMWCISRAAM